LNIYEYMLLVGEFFAHSTHINFLDGFVNSVTSE